MFLMIFMFGFALGVGFRLQVIGSCHLTAAAFKAFERKSSVNDMGKVMIPMKDS